MTATPLELVTGADLRRVMGHWATGIAVITTSDGGTLAGLDWERGVLGSPIVADDLPLIECRLWQKVDAGDHVILIGEVVNVSDPDGFIPLTNHVHWAK